MTEIDQETVRRLSVNGIIFIVDDGRLHFKNNVGRLLLKILKNRNLKGNLKLRLTKVTSKGSLPKKDKLKGI